MSGVDELFMYFVMGMKLSEYLVDGLLVIVLCMKLREWSKIMVLCNPNDVNDLKEKLMFMLV